MRFRPLSLSASEGYATAEFAVLVPALVAVMLLMVTGAGATATLVELQTRAGQVARLAARGGQWQPLVNPPLQAQLSSEGELIHVEIARPFTITLGSVRLGSTMLRADAWAANEAVP